MSRRTQRVAEAIRQVVSQAILFEVKDPRVSGVTVTAVEVAGDLRHAKVFVSVMGDEKAQKLVFRGLQSCRGFLQRRIAQGMDTRYTPVLHFVVDEGVKRSLEMSRLLDDLLPEPDVEESATSSED